MTQNYIGKVLFLQPKKEQYPCYSGEYICLEQSPNALFCLSTKGGYDSHELRTFYTAGDNEVTVVRASHDEVFLRRFVKNLKAFVAEKDKPGRHWVEHVYTSAGRYAELIERLLCDCGEKAVEISVDEYQVSVPKGTSKIRLVFV